MLCYVCAYMLCGVSNNLETPHSARSARSLLCFWMDFYPFMQGRTGFSNRLWQKYQSGPFDHGSVASEASGACNGWGPGARLRVPVGSRGWSPRENLGVYAILGVGENGFSDDILKQKS